MAGEARRRLIVALDFDRLAPAFALARRLAGTAGMFKVGSQLFTAEGPNSLRRLAALGRGLFLDLKFHDIPQTVGGAAAAAAALPGIRLFTLHALGGVEMMRAAVRAVQGPRRPKILAVTALTSLDAADLKRLGIQGAPGDWVPRLAQLAQECGVDGVVASAHDAQAIHLACGSKFLVVVPGVRPGSAQKDDQARVATPAEAIAAGADYIVVGRPITRARDPRAAAAAILAEIAVALRQRV